jgi:hypothetical protein
VDQTEGQSVESVRVQEGGEDIFVEPMQNLEFGAVRIWQVVWLVAVDAGGTDTKDRKAMNIYKVCCDRISAPGNKNISNGN